MNELKKVKENHGGQAAVFHKQEFSKALVAADTIEKNRELIRFADLAVKYAKAARLGLEKQNLAAEAKLRAQCKAGEMLDQILPHGGDHRSVSRSSWATLKKLGISRNESAAWRHIARIPEEKFEAEIKRVKAANRELTTTYMLFVARIHAQAVINASVNMPSLPDGKFHTIVADLPWPVEKNIYFDKIPEELTLPYPTQSEEWLLEFDMLKFAADDCNLFLWFPDKFCDIAHLLAWEWEFQVKQIMTWVKNRGITHNAFMCNTEHLLFCTKGRVKMLKTGLPLHFNGKVREHSRKPDEFYDLVRKASPGPRIDVFGREKRDGFEVWGNEADKFSKST